MKATQQSGSSGKLSIAEMAETERYISWQQAQDLPAKLINADKTRGARETAALQMRRQIMLQGAVA